MKAYSNETIENELQKISNWVFTDNAIEKHFVFANFSQALAFIVKLGILAEKQNHHPEIWNVYNKVILRLSTHDCNGVSEKDFVLAAAIDLL